MKWNEKTDQAFTTLNCEISSQDPLYLIEYDTKLNMIEAANAPSK